MSAERPDGRLLLGILALLAASWGVLGWMDISQRTEAGFSLDNRQNVTSVASGSPAGQAGLQVGDKLLSIGGIRADDTRALTRIPRAQAGDSRALVVEREGEERSLQITYGPLPERQQNIERSGVVLGFGFLLFPLLALARRATDATRVLLLMGIGLSLAVLDGPYIGDASARAMAAAISSLFAVVGVAAIPYFLLVFPRRRPLLDKAWAKTLLFIPALLLWLLLAWRFVIAPPVTELLNRFSGLVLGIVEGGYFLLALFLLLHNYSKTDRALRREYSLNLMLWGTLAGLLPAVIGLLARVFSPGSPLPGQDFYFMSLLLVPVSLAWSASRKP